MSKWANWHLVSVDPLAQSFTWEDQFLKAASCTKVSVWLLGHGDFFFCLVLLSWLRQNSPQCNKEYMLPSKLFPNSHTNWTWVFWEHFSWETGTTIRIIFQATIKFDLLGDLDFELTEIWLEAWFRLQQCLAVIQLEFFRSWVSWSWHLNECGFFLGKNAAVGKLGA